LIKIFQMNECDFIAAENMKEAIEYYKKEFDYHDEPDEEPVELSEKDLNTFRFLDEDDPKENYTFKDELEKNMKDGTIFPCLFASTES